MRFYDVEPVIFLNRKRIPQTDAATITTSAPVECWFECDRGALEALPSYQPAGPTELDVTFRCPPRLWRRFRKQRRKRFGWQAKEGEKTECNLMFQVIDVEFDRISFTAYMR